MCARPLLGLAYVGGQERPGRPLSLSLTAYDKLCSLPGGASGLGEREIAQCESSRENVRDRERATTTEKRRRAKNRGN